MSEREALKSRLSAEVATVIFGERQVPQRAWDRLDELVDETFGEAPTGRLRALVDDVGEVRVLEGRVESDVHRGDRCDGDWMSLQSVIDDATRELDPDRYLDPDDEASGARTLEVVSHGRG